MIVGGTKERTIHWAEAFGLSAAIHAGAIYALLNFAVDLDAFQAPDDSEQVDILITSVNFSTDALISAADNPSGGAEGEEGGTSDEVEAPEDIAPEELAPVTPEPDVPEPVAPEPETVEPVTPDVPELPVEEPEVPEAEAPEEIVPETPDAIEPEALTAEAPDLEPEALAPIESEAAALVPENLSPLRPQNDSLAALAPVTGGGGSGLAPEHLTATTPAPTAAAPARIGATSVERVTARATSPRPPANPIPTRAAPTPPAPGTPEFVVNELVSRLRTRVSDTCLIAVPQQAANGAPELVIFTASEGDIADYANAVLDGIEPRPGQRSVLVDPRQCDALNYLRENASYPAFRLGISLNTDQIDSGDFLRGSVQGAGGRYVSVIMIDDNGVVQDLGEYLSFAQNAARFEVPMRRFAGARDTKQLLIGIASDGRPAALDTFDGRLAEDFFAALKAELGVGSPIVMLPFDVR